MWQEKKMERLETFGSPIQCECFRIYPEFFDLVLLTIISPDLHNHILQPLMWAKILTNWHI
jgi:hypothetical protein